jgi:uncharacterized protein (TIGR01777 family)
MKLIIPGGTGQVGNAVARHFHRAGHQVVVLSRNPRPAPWQVIQWDGRTRGAWFEEIDGADAVLNLAGYTVNCRYHPANRQRILESRVESTRIVGEAIAAARNPPSLWLQAATATLYAHRYDAPNDDVTGVPGGEEPDLPDTWRFSLDVARAWEQACLETLTPRTPKVLLRTAMVMTPYPGAVFSVLLRLVRLGLGGRVGDGRQFVSWIHETDFLAALEFLMLHPELCGPINLAAPGPLPYTDFMAALRRAWGMPIGLPATRWMLEIGTWLLRTESELVLKSRRVVPRRLTDAGFQFRFPDWSTAATDLCQTVRGRN